MNKNSFLESRNIIRSKNTSVYLSMLKRTEEVLKSSTIGVLFLYIEENKREFCVICDFSVSRNFFFFEIKEIKTEISLDVLPPQYTCPFLTISSAFPMIFTLAGYGVLVADFSFTEEKSDVELLLEDYIGASNWVLFDPERPHDYRWQTNFNSGNSNKTIFQNFLGEESAAQLLREIQEIFVEQSTPSIGA